MLNIAIFLPFVTAVLVLFTPASRPLLVRWASLAGGVLTLAVTAILWIGFDPAEAGLQWRVIQPWIPPSVRATTSPSTASRCR